MARLPRYFVKGVPQHIILRGNNREPIFANDEDCLFFKDVLQDAAKRNGLTIHAYVFMTNHIHLLASPATEESIPKTLQSVGRRYVQYFNYCYQRTGTLWEGRYRATIVEAETYLFECMRYIELNPVRAGMVRHPSEHVWSSYRTNAGLAAEPLVKPHRLYRALGASDEARFEAYSALVQMPMDAEMLKTIRDSTNKGWAMGGGRFKSKIETLTDRRVAPLPKGRPKRAEPD
ncbi:MAG TPA: transposase [Burkholderiaceae bacterium]